MTAGSGTPASARAVPVCSAGDTSTSTFPASESKMKVTFATQLWAT